jgi:hypothetical protein
MRVPFSLIAVVMATVLAAQAPQRMTFQAVVRDAANELVVSSPVGIRISVLQGAPNGTPVFVETHAPQTNPLGLATLEVGGGMAVAGSFAGIDWAQGPYFLRIETDVTGGTDYTVTGTQQLLSVPYALYAATSGSGGATSLDAAYDGGTVITADAGPVTVNVSGATTTGIAVNSAVANSSAVLATQSGVGVGLRAESTNAGNTFAAIQGNTNSSVPENSAILGFNTGAGYAIAGQIPSTATGSSAILGSNLRTNGGNGVFGIGYGGVAGQAQNAAGFGVSGINNNASSGNALAIGVYGQGFNGVYGQTTDAANGWAGYFTADLGLEGTGYAMGGWVNVSDARLKSDIRPITGAIGLLQQLDGKHYTLTTKRRTIDGAVEHQQRRQYGLLAQSVESVFPEMVSEKALFLNTGDDTLYKTVDYIQLVPVLVEAVKELQQEVERLRAELEELR